MISRLRLHRLRGDESGLTLLEVTLILGALVILTAALTPAVLRFLTQARFDQARDELRALQEAMVGSDAAGTYGYVGDMGRLPDEIRDLVRRGDQPLFVTSEFTGVGYGWNGPYINRGRSEDDFAIDPWGSPYEVGTVSPDQIRSPGPDTELGTADDLLFPPQPMDVYGTVIVVVKGHSDDQVMTDPEGCVVALHFSAEGEADTVLDETAPFSFTNVHRGLHPVEVACESFGGAEAHETDVLAVRGGGAQQLAEIHVELGSAEGTETDEQTNETDSETSAATSSGPTTREVSDGRSR